MAFEHEHEGRLKVAVDLVAVCDPQRAVSMSRSANHSSLCPLTSGLCFVTLEQPFSPPKVDP